MTDDYMIKSGMNITRHYSAHAAFLGVARGKKGVLAGKQSEVEVKN